MEAMWTRYFPIHKKVRELIREGKLGEITGFICEFGFLRDPSVARLHSLELGGGALLDIGIYPLALAFDVFGQKPSVVQALGHKMETGADEIVSISLGFKPNQIASIYITFAANARCEASIYGTKGRVTINCPFWAPSSATLTLNFSEPEQFSIPAPVLPKDFPQPFFPGSPGMIYEVDHVNECILEGKKESELMTLKESLELAEVMEEIRKQIGVVYPADHV